MAEMAASAEVARLDRKFKSVFASTLATDDATLLGDPRLRDKIVAYAVNFAQQYLKHGRSERAAALLEAHARARAASNLPADRQALKLNPQVLSALAANQRQEIVHIGSELRAAPMSARAALTNKLDAVKRALPSTLEALHRSESAAAAFALPDTSTSSLTSRLDQMQLSAYRGAVAPPSPVPTTPGSSFAPLPATPSSASLRSGARHSSSREVTTPLGFGGPARTPTSMSTPLVLGDGRVSTDTPLLAPTPTPSSRVTPLLGEPSRFAALFGAIAEPAGAIAAAAPPAPPPAALPSTPAPATQSLPSTPAASAPTRSASIAGLSSRLSGLGLAPPSLTVTSSSTSSLELARASVTGGLGSLQSPPPAVAGASSLTMPSDVPTPPVASVKRDGPFGRVSLSSSLAGSGRRAGEGPAAATGGSGGGGEGALPSSGGGTLTVESWRVRSAALRAEAEAMLSGIPNRRSPSKASSTASAGTTSPGATPRGATWMYKYLLYEPLTVSIGADGAHECRLAGTAASEALASGDLYSATLDSEGASATLTIRLFSSVAPSAVALLHVAIEDTLREQPSGAVCAGPAPSTGGAILTVGLARAVPTDKSIKDAVASDEECVKEAGRLPHERAGLLCLLLGAADTPPPMPTGAAATAAAARKPTLAVCLGASPPDLKAYGASLCIPVGRLIDGVGDVRELLDAAPGPPRLLRWQKTPAPALGW